MTTAATDFGRNFGNAAANNPPSGGAFIEHFKRGADGQVADTQNMLVSHEDAYATTSQGQYGDDDQNNSFFGNLFGGNRSNGQWIGRSYYPNQGWGSQAPQAQAPQQQQPARGFFQPWNWSDNPQPAQRSQNYYGGRSNY